MLFLKERVRNPAKAKNHCPGSGPGGLDHAYLVRCLDRYRKCAWGLHGPTHHRQVDESEDHELRAKPYLPCAAALHSVPGTDTSASAPTGLAERCFVLDDVARVEATPIITSTPSTIAR